MLGGCLVPSPQQSRLHHREAGLHNDYMYNKTTARHRRQKTERWRQKETKKRASERNSGSEREKKEGGGARESARARERERERKKKRASKRKKPASAGSSMAADDGNQTSVSLSIDGPVYLHSGL